VHSELVSIQGCEGGYVICMVSNYLYVPCSRYGLDKKLWGTRCFSKLVNITDEALVMQVVTNYFPRWTLGIETLDEEGETIVVGAGKRIGGAVKGEKNTGSRTMEVYSNYAAKFKKTRNTEYTELWDKKLREAAIKQNILEVMEKEAIAEGEREPGSAVEKDNFDVDLMNGCFDGDVEEDEVGTVVTAEV
jgi:hypothetical protein